MSPKKIPRKRIYELAKTWEVPSSTILAELAKIGLGGKTASSSLRQEEIVQLRERLGLSSAPAPRGGTEQVVSERVIAQRTVESAQVVTTTQQVVESRLRSGVIRRRTTRVEAQRESGAEPEKGAATAKSGIREPFVAPQPAAVAFLPNREAMPATEPLETQAPEMRPPAQDAPAATMLPRPRVLGRIDLSQVSSPPGLPSSASPSGPVSLKEKQAPHETRETIGQHKPRRRKSWQRPATVTVPEPAQRQPRVRAKKRARLERQARQTERTVPKASKRVIRLAEGISVGNLAKEMGIKVGEVIAALIELGVMATINQMLDVDTATLVAAEFGYHVENIAFDVETFLLEEAGVRVQAEAVPRPLVVAVLGHVDHGKTSLLDAIRQTNIIAQEAGGITQHIGASEIELNGRKITFLDTPGHEAFTAMRARGAQVTDLVVIVVAADEGVMPQTVEALSHARAAQVPFLIALTKIDKPDANVERVTRELATQGVVPEEWGGETLMVPVSALSGEGIPLLLEMLLLQADMQELTARCAGPAKGSVIEAKLDKGRGPVATVLVQAGRLRVGDPCVCGTVYGKVRALFNSQGQRMLEATPATPVEVLGLSGVAAVGDTLLVVQEEGQARQVAEHRQRQQREVALAQKFSLADLAKPGVEQKELRVVLKADVQGSVEALREALRRLSTDKVKLKVLHASVGGIAESDVLLASASNAIVLGFQVRPEPKATQLAQQEQVELRLYSVIYELLVDVRTALEGLLPPLRKETLLGRLEVRQVFRIPHVGVVAGGLVTDGNMVRGAQVRLVREQIVVYQGRVASLRRFQEDVHTVATGYECGVGLEHFGDIKVGDTLEAFAIELIPQSLEHERPEPEWQLSA